jgi:hypothetical protein
MGTATLTLEPLIAGAAGFTREALEAASEPAQEAICKALEQGAEVSVLLTVLPEPKLALVLVEPTGGVLTLLQIEMTNQWKQ